jgi:hypothetical protein
VWGESVDCCRLSALYSRKMRRRVGRGE